MDTDRAQATGATAPDFSEYVASRRPSLLRAARAITGDAHAAEDLLQIALTRVCSRWAQVRDPGALDGYVRRTMVNQHASWYRQPWRTRERSCDRLPEPDGRWIGTDVPDVGRDHALWPLVAALPPRQRSAVVLRYYEGLSEAETARVLACSIGTVKSNTSRGLSALRRMAAGADLDLAG